MTRARSLSFVLPRAALGILGALTLILSSARAQSSIIANAPVKNFRLPSFNDQGQRTRFLRGSEARYISQTQIDITDLNFAQFPGDGSTDATNLLLASSATVSMSEKDRYILSGKESVRLIAKNAEATGEDWTYDYTGQRLILNKNVRVVFDAQLKGILD
jgi:hypothetical protein